MELSSDQLSALRDLVRDGVLTDDQEQAVRARLHHPSTSRPLVEVAGYVGGGLALGGAALLAATSWDELSRTGKVGLTLVATLVLLAAGWLIAAKNQTGVRRRIGGVLFALASGTAAICGGAAVDQDELFVGSAAGLVVAAVTSVVLPTPPGLLAAGLFSALFVGDAVGEQFGGTGLAIGLSLFALGAGWCAAAMFLPFRHVCLAIGTAIALVGAQIPVLDDWKPWGYALTALLAAACFVGYLREQLVVPLIAGVVATTLVVPEAVWDWTDGAVSGGGLVLVAGVVLIAASGIGLRLRKSAN